MSLNTWGQPSKTTDRVEESAGRMLLVEMSITGDL